MVNIEGRDQNKHVFAKLLAALTVAPLSYSTSFGSGFLYGCYIDFSKETFAKIFGLLESFFPEVLELKSSLLEDLFSVPLLQGKQYCLLIQFICLM